MSKNRQEENTMPKCNFNKVSKQLYRNYTSTWVFSCICAAYFQNTFFTEHLWKTISASFIFLFVIHATEFSHTFNDMSSSHFCFIYQYANVCNYFLDSNCNDDPNQQEFCDFFKSQGFCDIDPSLMEQICRKTCNLCNKGIFVYFRFNLTIALQTVFRKLQINKALHSK